MFQRGSACWIAELRRHRLEIRNLYVAVAVYDPLKEDIGAIWPSNLLGHILWIPVDRDCTERFAIVEGQSAAGSAAKSVRLLQYRIEHRPEVARRGIDDLQYL